MFSLPLNGQELTPLFTYASCGVESRFRWLLCPVILLSNVLCNRPWVVLWSKSDRERKRGKSQSRRLKYSNFSCQRKINWGVRQGFSKKKMFAICLTRGCLNREHAWNQNSLSEYPYRRSLFCAPSLRNGDAAPPCISQILAFILS